MSENKEVKKITTKEDIKIDDKDDKDNNEAITKVLEDMCSYKYCKTDILHKVNFMSDMDKFVFESLPLTNSQKEELLLSLYPITE